jgi:hypothetical protein
MLKITYNGRSYSDIGAAMRDALQQGIEEAIKEDLNQRLEILSEEINTEGGTIHVRHEGDSLIITHEGFSDSLGERIEAALNA